MSSSRHADKLAELHEDIAAARDLQQAGLRQPLGLPCLVRHTEIIVDTHVFTWRHGAAVHDLPYGFHKVGMERVSGTPTLAECMMKCPALAQWQQWAQ